MRARARYMAAADPFSPWYISRWKCLTVDVAPMHSIFGELKTPGSSTADCVAPLRAAMHTGGSTVPPGRIGMVVRALRAIIRAAVAVLKIPLLICKLILSLGN